MAVDKERKAADKIVPMARVAKDQTHLLPQNLEAEAALIGCLLIAPEEVLKRCADVLPRHFLREQHRTFWAGAQALHEQGVIPDLITLSDWLMQQGKSELVTDLAACANNVPSTRNLHSYAEIVKRTARQRLTIEFSGQLAAVAYSAPDDMLAYWTSMQSEVNAELGAAEAGRFQLKSIQQIRERERAQWIVPGILQERKQWLIFGDSNTGKSFVALDLALCMATGTPWLGKPMPSGYVVYVCAEGIDGIRDRIDAWLLHHGLEDAPRFFVIDESPNLLELGDVAGVIAQIKTLDAPPVCVVFDTLAASMEGGDENSPEDMTAAVGAIRRVQRECESAVLTVHHSGKDSTKGARGHTSLRAAMDTQIEVSYDADSGIQTMSCKKNRDAPWFEPVTFRRLSVALDEYADITSVVLVPTNEPAPRPKAKATRATATDKLYETLLSFGSSGATNGELRRAFVERWQMSDSAFNKALDELYRISRAEAVHGRWRVAPPDTKG